MSLHYVRPRKVGKLYATTTVNLMLSWGGILCSYAPEPWVPHEYAITTVNLTGDRIEGPTDRAEREAWKREQFARHYGLAQYPTVIADLTIDRETQRRYYFDAEYHALVHVVGQLLVAALRPLGHRTPDIPNRYYLDSWKSGR